LVGLDADQADEQLGAGCLAPSDDLFSAAPFRRFHQNWLSLGGSVSLPTSAVLPLQPAFTDSANAKVKPAAPRLIRFMIPPQ
jgi:hypothetical protein